MPQHDSDSSSTTGAMQVDTDLVRELAALLTETGLSEIEVGDGGRKVRVARTLVGATVASAPALASSATAGTPAPAPEQGEDLSNAILSPMVGTAYLAAEPGADPFVKPGQSVEAGETLLIVEAMKVMNPIAATRSGTVRKLMVSNGQPVEFDQPLVIVE